MNYTKYIPQGQEVHSVIHQHWLVIFDKCILWIIFGSILPSYLYYASERLQSFIPFLALEILLFLVFIKISYELFNWYMDVWIVSDEAVYSLEWSLLKTNVESVHHENIEGIEIDKDRIWDTIFNKGDIIIKKFGEDEIAILDAYDPYSAVSVLDSFIHKPEEKKEDRFEIILETLSGVIGDFLERKGKPGDEDIKNDAEVKAGTPKNTDPYTLDLR